MSTPAPDAASHQESPRSDAQAIYERRRIQNREAQRRFRSMLRLINAYTLKIVMRGADQHKAGKLKKEVQRFNGLPPLPKVRAIRRRHIQVIGNQRASRRVAHRPWTHYHHYPLLQRQ